MAKYKHTKTGDVVEFDDAHFEQIKHQGNYEPVASAPARKAPAKKAAAKKAAPKKAAKK